MASAVAVVSAARWWWRILAVVLVMQCVRSTSSGCTGAGQQPMRLVLNTTALVSNEDPRTCRAVGQVVDLSADCNGGCSTYTCTEADIVDGHRFAACAQSAVVAVEERFGAALCMTRAADVNEFEVDGSLYMVAADHVVFVAARPIGTLGSVVATQQSTRTDSTGRPTSSNIIFLPSIVHDALAASDAVCYATMHRLMLHFATHVVGFDVVHMANWRVPGTEYRYAAAPDNAYPHGPVLPYDTASEVVMRPTNETVFGLYTTSLIGPSRRVMLVSPNALAAARLHFGCPTMRGVLIEELGPSELHWERRILNFELMSSEFNMANHSAWSSITLAALLDTGFYTPSTTAVTDDYAWGRNKGCAFVEAECSPESWGAVFCNGTFGVGYDRSYIAECGNTDLPTNFTVPPYQHFDNPSLGGWDPYADFCPFAGNTTVERVVARCSAPRDSEAVDSVFSNISGLRTVAVWTSVLNQSSTISNRDPFQLVPRCMQFLCLNASYLMFRAGDAWFPCRDYPALSEITFPGSGFSVGPQQAPFDAAVALPSFGFYGQLQCPNVTDVCPTGSALYGASRFFSSAYYPQLVNITPTQGSVAGGTVLTVTATFARFTSGTIRITCQGLLIGGQPTNLSSFEYRFQESKGGRTLHYFTVNTSEVLTAGVLGGSNADGSGPVDVGLLCTVADAMECGPRYGGQCVVDLWRGAYTWESLPAAPAELGFLGTVVGQAIMALLGISVMVVLLVTAATLAGRKHHDKDAAAAEDGDGGAEEMNETLLKVNDDDDDGDVELENLVVDEAANDDVADVHVAAASPSQPQVETKVVDEAHADPLASDDIDDDDDDLLGSPPPPPPTRTLAPPQQVPQQVPLPPPSPPAKAAGAAVRKKKKVKGRRGPPNGDPLDSDEDPPPPPPPPPDDDDTEIAL